jgi:hypothetical protein
MASNTPILSEHRLLSEGWSENGVKTVTVKTVKTVTFYGTLPTAGSSVEQCTYASGVPGAWDR